MLLICSVTTSRASAFISSDGILLPSSATARKHVFLLLNREESFLLSPGQRWKNSSNNEISFLFTQAGISILFNWLACNYIVICCSTEVLYSLQSMSKRISFILLYSRGAALPQLVRKRGRNPDLNSNAAHSFGKKFSYKNSADHYLRISPTRTLA